MTPELEKGLNHLTEVKKWVDAQTFNLTAVEEYWRGWLHGMESLLETIYDVDLIWDGKRIIVTRPTK